MNQHVKHISLAATFVVATLGQIDSASSSSFFQQQPQTQTQQPPTNPNTSQVSESTEGIFLPHEILTSKQSAFHFGPKSCEVQDVKENRVLRGQYCMFKKSGHPNFTEAYLNQVLDDLQKITKNSSGKYVGKVSTSQPLLKKMCVRPTKKFTKNSEKSLHILQEVCAEARKRGLLGSAAG